MIHSNHRRAAALATAAFAPAALALGACKQGRSETPAPEKESVMTVGTENIAVARQGTVVTGPTLSGSLVPERNAQVRAEVSGSVTQVYVDAGQPVGRAAPLARIDPAGIQDAFLSARAGVTAAQNNADAARRDAERARTLFASGAIAQRDVENAERAAVAANAALSDARARLASAQRQYTSTTLRAPFGGIVADRQVSPGDVVSPGTLLFTVVDPSSMQLEASVAAEALAQVRVGMPVTFTVSGYPNREFAGKVTRVSPVVDPTTRQVRIIASVPNAERALVGGVFAEGRVASVRHDGVVVPASAIDTRGISTSALRVKQGRVERVPVTIGARDDAAETVEVTAGIAVGDTLLVGAAMGLSPGSPVRVTAPPADRAAR